MMNADNIWCRLFGHDWSVWPDETKQCGRCGETKEVDIERTDEDPTAEEGDTRVSIEKDHGKYRVEIESYRVTAWGEDSKYYQWATQQYLRLSEDEMESMFEETAKALDLEDSIEVDTDD